jgi:hypothetical protein
MHLKSLALIAAIATGLLLCRSGFAQGLVYESQIIARSGDVFGNRVAEAFRCPDINNRGETVFEAATALGEIIVASNGIEIFSREFIGGNRLTTMNSVQINDAGDIYFSAAYTDPQGNSRAGIFRHDGAIALRGDRIETFTIANLTEESFPVNASGEIAFIAPFNRVGGPSGTTVLVATQHRVIAERGDVIGGAEIQNIWDTAINDHGDVVFFSGSPDVVEGIFSDDELLLSPGMMLGGRLLTGVNRPAINNRNDLALVANYFGGTGVFVNDEQVAATGQAIDGYTLIEISSSAPALNNRGDVAFFASYNGGHGIFTPTQRILAYGEFLGDIRVGGHCEPEINDRGQIITAFSDFQSQNMYVAVFTPVPEPSGIALVGGAGVVMLIAAVRRRGRRLCDVGQGER